MIELTKNQIDRSLNLIGDVLNKYIFLQDRLNKVDVSKSKDFQKRFTRFYRVQRNSAWLSRFYDLLQNKKKVGVSFPEALKIIHANTGKIEASFASRLVATIHTEKPVIDRFVLKNTGLRLPYGYSRNREEKIVTVYNKLQLEFEEFFRSENGKYLANQFLRKFPAKNISKMRMADFVLWQTR